MFKYILGILLSISLAFADDKAPSKVEDNTMDMVSYSLFFIRYEPMFNQLKKGLGIIGDDIDFMLINDNDVVNAFADTASGRKQVILMTGFIQYFRERVSINDLDEIIAEVLAHELAHIALGHTKTGEGSEPTTEIEADLFALKLLVRTGFPCMGGYKGAKVFQDNRTEFTTHPPMYFRAVYLKAMCEVEMEKYGN